MFSLPMRYANIREIPYPYKGIVAISSDAEYTSQEFLEWLIVYCNTTENTPLGDGLGIQFSASLFFYSDCPLHTSIYDSLSVDSRETKYANFLKDCIKEGYIDTNHAFGDFTPQNNFTREHAIKVYEMLEKYNLSIPIFTNHGNGNEDSMQHNIGFLPYHHGSDPIHSSYHADLFRQRGGRYVWTDDWVCEKFPAISLNGKSCLVQDGRQPCWGGGIFRSLFCGDSNYLFFCRYRSTGVIAPTFQTFNYQISSVDWNKFYQNSCVMIFYQHFGSFYVAEKNVPTTTEVLKKFPYYLLGLRFLKEQQDAGNLLILKTSRLLQYCEMYFSTKVDIEKTENIDTYIVSNYEQINDLKFFDGLTIYVENPKKTIRVRYNDKKLNFIRNGLDARAKYSITIKGA